MLHDTFLEKPSSGPHSHGKRNNSKSHLKRIINYYFFLTYSAELGLGFETITFNNVIGYTCEKEIHIYSHELVRNTRHIYNHELVRNKHIPP